MIGSRISFFIVGVLSAVRSAVLLRRKGYREFPALMFLFLFGGAIAAYGLARYAAGDLGLRPGGKGGGVAWYQDAFAGLALAGAALAGSLVAASQKSPKQPPQHKEGSRPSLNDSPAPEIPPSPAPRGASRSVGQSRRTILNCFDPELVQRAKQILKQAGIPVRVESGSDGEMPSLRLDVDEADAERATGLVEVVHASIESERSLLKCIRCGTGMIAKEVPRGDEEEEPLVVEYQCPRCGAPGLMNVS